MTTKRLFKAFLIVIVICLAALFISNKVISGHAAGKLYSETALIPYNKVGLLLGTARLNTQGTINPFYSNRIAAAIELLRARKIKYLVISGDNSRKDYNEPEDMRQDLVHAGIDSSVIFLDYAGFRTFDSIKRLKEIFGQDSVTIISQKFHNERALYIASRMGIAAIGYNAKDVSGSAGIKTWAREKFARAKVFLDFWFGKEPRFLGPRVMIP
jgi:SanA protein